MLIKDQILLIHNIKTLIYSLLLSCYCDMHYLPKNCYTQ